MLSFFFGGGGGAAGAAGAKKAKKRKPRRKKASEQPLNLDFDEEDDSDDDDGGAAMLVPVIVPAKAIVAAADDDMAGASHLGDPIAATVDAIARRAAAVGAAPFTRAEVEACVRQLWDDGKAYDDPEVPLLLCWLLPLRAVA